MAESSRIEWTDATWNVVTGCDPESMGCQNCYARRMARRLQAMGQPRYQNGFAVTCHYDLLELPLRWKKPRRIFVCSMGDLFHDFVPSEFLGQVFDVIRQASNHIFQVLTKRIVRAKVLGKELCWPPNVWLGTTVEHWSYNWRAHILSTIDTAVRFLSLEPLLSPNPNVWLDGIQWVIVGGESGPGARRMRTEWVREIRDRCVESQVPFFFKQWGGKQAGRLLDGRTWDEMPN